MHSFFHSIYRRTVAFFHKNTADSARSFAFTVVLVVLQNGRVNECSASLDDLRSITISTTISYHDWLTLNGIRRPAGRTVELVPVRGVRSRLLLLMTRGPGVLDICIARYKIVVSRIVNSSIRIHAIGVQVDFVTPG